MEEDFDEDNSLIALDVGELEKLDRTLERYIQNQDDTENLWILIDNLVTLEDNVIHLQKSYYEGFDTQILKTKSLLESASVIAEDRTVKELLKEALDKVVQCIDRLGIKEEYQDQKYQEPYEPKKSGYPKRYSYQYPYKEPNSPEEEAGQDLSRALMYQNKEPIPSRFKLDLLAKEPDETAGFWSSVLAKVESNKLEFEKKKRELSELNRQKLELSQEQDTLARFRQKLLNRCLDELIKGGK
jgi:hypothetical protein